jgi:hypothetical protein
MAMPAMSWRRLVLRVSTLILLSGCAGSIASTSPVARPSVVVASSSVEPSPSVSPPDSAPRSPAKTTFKFVKEVVATDGTTTEHYRATWTEPDGAATKFLVYGVTDCLRSSQANDNTPCVTETTEIPAGKLELISTVPGTDRSLEVSWTLEGEAGPGPYQAVVIVAVNGKSKSSPAILWSAPVCYRCVI